MTGGWNALTNEADVLDSPFWRFCGVFMGDAQSILEFCELYKACLPEFLTKHGKWVWEFNVWAWMEFVRADAWNAVWYRESPDIDELFMCSSDHYTQPLATTNHVDYMDYTIHNYYAASSSYVKYKGEHYLNTRFVNYWIAPNGAYLFHDNTNTIQNKNVLSKLNPSTYSPEVHWEIREDLSMNHTLCAKPISTGLEDIRMFEHNGRLHYVATTIGYTEHGKPRIMMGEYNIESQCITDGTIIEPPEDTYCEKNWIPISTQSDLLFIYKWHPMQIGKVVNGKLEIIEEFEVDSLIFRRIRGSTPFIETERGLLGVVHYSENHTPRHYYHMFVLLDKTTFELLEYSNTFCFEKLGIEFCIGFTIHPETQDYIFWISRHDRDPCMITAPSNTWENQWFSAREAR